MSVGSPDLGHQSGRALSAARVPTFFGIFRAAISNRRRAISNRFRQPSDWIRLVALGILLIDLAALSLLNTLSGWGVNGYRPGMGAVFGGLLTGIITIRVARPALYMDWIATGILQIGLGFILSGEPQLAAMPAFALFCILFAALGTVRLWIGATLEPGKGAASLMAGGLTSLFCVAWAVIDRFAAIGVASDVIVATDLLLTGISIVGFGLALRHPPSKME